MEENDFKRIEQLVSGVVDAKLGIHRQDVKEDLQKFRKEFREEINGDFRHHVGILTEDFHHKLQLVAEGHQMLSEKMDRMHGELAGKVDAVAVDLAAHRADTEGHKRGYMIKEP